MHLKKKIATIQFLQFFIWGSWMMTMGPWWFDNKHWTAAQLGAVFSTIGISSMFMPTIIGIMADRFVNAEKLYGMLHFGGAIILFYIPHVKTPQGMFWAMLLNMLFYMPTVPLLYTISYSLLKKAGMDIIKEYPPLRVLGTVGFIAAMWTVSLLHLETSSWMFYLAGISSLVLAGYSFKIPKCPPSEHKPESLIHMLGLDAFYLFKDKNIAIFLIFSMLLGAALQLSNIYGNAFLHNFADNYRDYLTVKHPAIILSLSQISEVCFIVVIPFFMQRFGIKKVMMMSMFAWVLRFGLFGFGNPAEGLWMIILSCIVYGIAFDFFNVSGSLYIDMKAPSNIRASAQGLLMLMSNGIGVFFGSMISGLVISKFFTYDSGAIHWQGMDGAWVLFAIYATIVGVFFTFMFKYKHVTN
jgi:NHS family xanthosine MFS transporter